MKPTSTTLFLQFLQAGGLTIANGYTLIHPIRRVVVTQNHWMNEEDFNRHLATVQAMPGIFQLNLATYLGRQLLGWKGSVACIMGILLPSLLIFLLLSTFFSSLCEVTAMKHFLRGMRPAIVAIVALPCLQLWKSSNITLSTVWIPIGAAVAIGIIGISPTYIILGLAALAALYAILVYSNDDK